MSHPDQLPLASPLWNQLGNYAVPPGRVPALIHELLHEPINPPRALDELTAAIFHQHSLADATYVVMPYLHDIYERYAATNPGLFYLAANIAAVAELDALGLPPMVQRGFRGAMAQFEASALARITAVGRPLREVYSDTTAALAFAGHCGGKLLMDVLDVEGPARTSLICPSCEGRLQVILFDEGIVAERPGAESQPPDPPRPLASASLHPYPERRPNPWRSLGAFIADATGSARLSESERSHVEVAVRTCEWSVSAATPSRGVFSLIGAVLLSHQFSATSSHRFFRMWDGVTCPMCATEFVAADRWWGCVA